jgi:hypothetical protein
MNDTAQRQRDFAQFTVARGRPALFLILQQPLNADHLLLVRAALADRHFPELDLVVHCHGGSIHTAYQIVALLRLHCSTLIAVVPLRAKSAGTLLTIGADRIVMDEIAELGPLDTQIYEERPGGKGEFTSALNPFKALEQLQAYSLETLDLAMRLIVRRSGLDLDNSLRAAIEFVRATTGPLLAQLEAEKLGEYSRALSIGEEYGKRLLRRSGEWDEEKASTLIQRLVHGYPTHEYVIDYAEALDLGLPVELFAPCEHAAVLSLYPHLASPDDLIELVQPPPSGR